jgi:hypothetical protein
MDAEEWKLRVLHLLRERGQQTSSEIGALVKRDRRMGRVCTLLLSDARFRGVAERDGGFRFSLSGVDHVDTTTNAKKVPVKRRKTAPKEPSFRPQTTDFQPPCACWEVVLANPTTLSVLTEWRWLWLLPQVCRAFRHGLQPERCFRGMCAADVRSVIWKSKANDLFALSRGALANVECTVVAGVGWMRYKEVHLMRRDTVLQLALAKHGDSFAGINAAFIKRVAKGKAKK